MQKILLIDDSKSFHVYFNNLLQAMDLDVEIINVMDPTKALELALTHSPDIIFTDLEMPNLSGFDICSLFKSHQQFKKIPVIVLTSSEGDQNLILAIEAGADDFLIKKSALKVIQMQIKGILRLAKFNSEAHLEAELRLKEEQQKLFLLSRLNTIGQVTSQVAHDFSNLVMIINGKINALDKILQDEVSLKLTTDIRKATNRTQGLIKRILSLTRPSNESRSQFDPYSYLSELEDLLKMAVGSSVQLTIEAQKGPPCLIETNTSTFENIILNLCVNARDAMNAKGELIISVTSSIKGDKEYALIAVKDTGPGIPKEIQSRIFEPFFTTKNEGNGHGLGLSQFFDFVKNNNGQMDLESNSQGTCFKMYLPKK